MSERLTIHLNDLEKNEELLAQLKGKCMVANGCFDGLHPGHLSLFGWLDTAAYYDGLRPLVAINSDESVRRLKGSTRPVYPQNVRGMLINYLKWPLTVVIFDEDTPQRLMDLLEPPVVVKGYDYKDKDVVKWSGSRVVLTPYVEGWSSSRLHGDTR